MGYRRPNTRQGGLTQTCDLLAFSAADFWTSDIATFLTDTFCPIKLDRILAAHPLPLTNSYLNIRRNFEYYARHENEGDYEVIQTVAPEEFAAIANKFGLDPTSDILAIVQQISDAGRGEELVDTLNSKEIKCEIWTWMS